MISYELAKKLKDAGFPQDSTHFIMRKYSLDNVPVIWERPPEGIDVTTLSGSLEWEVALPLLEELIEACGKDFEKLHQFKKLDGEEIELWKKIWGDDTPLPLWGAFSYSHVCYGKTSEEAVARLWLKLHEKK